MVCGNLVYPIIETVSVYAKVMKPHRPYKTNLSSFFRQPVVCRRISLHTYIDLQTIKRQKIRNDMIKIMTNNEERAKCPHYHQVRPIAFHDIQAKGPAYTRSLIHKVLGNEEFCLQMDAHSKVAPNWDVLMKEEWKSINNEFAVLSTLPPPVADMDELLPGSSSSKANQVPRQCMVKFRENGVPVGH